LARPQKTRLYNAISPLNAIDPFHYHTRYDALIYNAAIATRAAPIRPTKDPVRAEAAPVTVEVPVDDALGLGVPVVTVPLEAEPLPEDPLPDDPLPDEPEDVPVPVAAAADETMEPAPPAALDGVSPLPSVADAITLDPVAVAEPEEDPEAVEVATVETELIVTPAQERSNSSLPVLSMTPKLGLGLAPSES